MSSLRLIPVLASMGCPWVTPIDLYDIQDSDGDGHVAAQFGGDDCDDTDPSTFGKETFYADADGDGFGDPLVDAEACARPSGHVANADDCDDADADQHPDAVWAPDADCDGHGDPATTVASCTRPEATGEPCADGSASWARLLDDCDDTRADVYPDAPGEVPLDGIDTDCLGDHDLHGDDGLPQMPEGTSCNTVGARKIHRIPEDYTDLQSALDEADACDVIEVATDVSAGLIEVPIAIVAAPGTRPRLIATPADVPGIDVRAGHGVTLSGLTLDGFGRGIVMGGASSLLAEDVEVIGGRGITGMTDSTLELYDVTIADGGTAVDHVAGPLLHLERCTIRGALASIHTIFSGADHTRLLQTTISRSSSATGALLRADSATVDIIDAAFVDSVGVALQIGGGLWSSESHVLLESVTIADNVSVGPYLVSVEGHRDGSLVIDDLEVRDNIWTRTEGPAVVQVEREEALVSIIEIPLTASDVRMRGNRLLRPGPNLLMLGEDDLSDTQFQVSHLELAGATLTEGIFISHGTIDQSTIVGLGTGIVSFGTAYLDRSILAHNALVGATLIGSLDVSGSILYDNLVDVPANLPPGENPQDVRDLLRYHPELPSALWDLTPHPESNAFAAGVGAVVPEDTEDLDGDGLYDAWERAWIGDLSEGADGDPDEDGRTTKLEFDTGTHPTLADTDADGVIDSSDDCPLDPTQTMTCTPWQHPPPGPRWSR